MAQVEKAAKPGDLAVVTVEIGIQQMDELPSSPETAVDLELYAAVTNKADGAVGETQRRESDHKTGEDADKPVADASALKKSSKDKSPKAKRVKSNGDRTITISDTQMEEYRGIALRLYNEEFLSINAEEYTQFLASQDQESVVICELYMDLFQWDKDLLKSTRMLCLKLHLKGESQEIDRILSAFTRAYLKRHPDNVFCTKDFEKIYIVLYSLILLNTNLHNAEVGKRSKISQIDYIGNTLSTFIQQNRKAVPLTVKQRIQIERELHSYYDALAKEQLFLKTDDVAAAADNRMLAASKRLSVADTVLSGVSHFDSELDSRQPPHGADTGKTSAAALNGNAFASDSNRHGVAATPLQPFHDRRPYSQMPHTPVKPGANLSSANVSHRASAQTGFGFTRALASEVPAHRASAASSLRAAHNDMNLNRRSSRASLMTKESHQSHDHTEDMFSMVSFEDNSGFNYDFGSYNTYDQDTFDVEDFQDRIDLQLELQGSPYLKEGLLKLRILNNDNSDFTGGGENDAASALELSIGQRSNMFSFFRSFTSSKPKPAAQVSLGSLFQKQTEYFVVVSKGELRLYSFDPKTVKKQQKKQQKSNFFSGVEEEVGDGNWLRNAANVGNYNLCSTVARLERNSTTPNGVKKPIWTLIFPRVSKKPQKRFVFEAGTHEVANEFVNTCNFWASKITAVPPLEETVSSIEYGWTDLDSLQYCRDGFKKTRILSKWEPLPRGVYFSNYVLPDLDAEPGKEHEGIMKQFLQTLKYYNHLKSLYMQFSRQKVMFVKMFRRFAGCSNYTLVVNNYEQKSHEYKSELTRYKSYIVMLAYGLKLRLDLEDEDRQGSLSLNDNDYDTTQKEPSMSRLSLFVTAKTARPDTNIGGEKDDDIKTVVIREINKLLNTSSEMNRLFANDPNYKAEVVSHNGDTNSIMVKSPKTYSIPNLTDFDSSPIKQLLSIDSKPEHERTIADMTTSFSTATIREEEEPEDK